MTFIIEAFEVLTKKLCKVLFLIKLDLKKMNFKV